MSVTADNAFCLSPEPFDNTRWYCQKVTGDRQDALSAVKDMQSWNSEVAY